MSDKSAIEWTEATWNPTTGCDRTSPGCDNCYALALAKRLKAMGNPKYQLDGQAPTSGPGFGVNLHPAALELPLRWSVPKRVFVDSMSDLFHPQVPDEFIVSVFDVMASAAHHEFQLLTKRSKRVADLAPLLNWPVNVWMGVSIEDDRYTFRANDLRLIPAAVRFLSLEPLLGPVPSLDLSEIDWVIAGGESGPRARPMKADWVVEVRERCAEAEVPFFFKQWGGRTPKAGGRTLEGRTWDEFPRQRVGAVSLPPGTR